MRIPFQAASAAVLSFCAVAVPQIALAASPPAEIVIGGDAVFPESITSTKDGSIITGSAGTRAIFRAAPGAAKADIWIKPESDTSGGFLGVLADDKSNTLWACQLAGGAQGQPPTSPAVLRAYDLKTGATKGSWTLPTTGGICNDVAVGKDGTVYATDTPNMEVVRLKKGAKALETWVGGGSFGPKGGILDGIAVLGDRVLVNALATSKLFAVPITRTGAAGAVVEVQLDHVIERPDGMRSFGKNALLVAEGGAGGALSKVVLKGDTGVRTVLKQGFPDGPVAVTAVGTTAYVLEGQLAARRAPAGTPTKPFKATAVSVGKP